MNTTPATPILLNCYTTGSDERLLWKLETTEGILFVYDNLFRKSLKEAGIAFPESEPGKNLRGLVLKNKIYRHRVGDLIPETKSDRFKDDGFHIVTPLQFFDDYSEKIRDVGYHDFIKEYKSENLAKLSYILLRKPNVNYYIVETDKGNFFAPEKVILSILKKFGIEDIIWCTAYLLYNMLLVNEIMDHQAGDPIPGAGGAVFKKQGKHINGFMQVIGDLNWEQFEDSKKFKEFLDQLREDHPE